MITPKQVRFQVEADGKTIDLVQDCWSPMKSFRHLPLIGKTFAVPVSMLLSGASEEGLNGKSVAEALYLLFQEMEQGDVFTLFNLIVEGVMFENRQVNLDEDFGCDLGAVFTVIAEAVMNNYGSLFSGKGFGALVERMVPMAQLAKM